MKQSKITIPGETIVQHSLFANEVPKVRFHQNFPEVKATEDDFDKLLEEFDPAEGLGLDYEFDPSTYRPTIIGIADRNYSVSLPASDNLARRAIDSIFSKQSRFVGYSIFGAEKPIIDKVYGGETPLDIWDDGLRSFFLANNVLCKSPGKDEDEGGSLGFMNLSTSSTYYTGIPVYKVCVGPNTKVLTDKGYIKIKDLKNNYENYKALSVDHNNNRIHSRITDFYESKQLDRKIYRLQLVNGLKNSIFLTEDHEVLTKDRGWQQVKDVHQNEQIASGKPGLTQKQKELLTGMYFGDSFFEKAHGKIRLFHCKDQEEYLDLKVKSLSNLGFGKKHTKKGKNNVQDFITQISNGQECLKTFSPYENFSWLSLAILYLDDGYISRDNRCEIASTSHKKEDVDWLINQINLLNIFPSARKSTSMKGYRLDFNVEETKKLIKLISPAVPPSMRYKLKDLDAYTFNEDWYSCQDINDYLPCITQITQRRYKKVYCLGVEDTENFITNAGVVHNCRGALCYGPCPYHRVFEYNGVDAWCGLMVHLAALEDFYRKGGNYETYRRKIELGELCYKEQHIGIHTDKLGIAALEEKMAEKKKSLFTDKSFNPSSSIQIINKAKSLGAAIAKADIKQIQKSCEKELKKFGYASITDFEAVHGEGQEDFDPEFVAKKIEKFPEKNSEVAAFFYRLYKYKKTGKGTKSWFDEKYYSRMGVLTPRFNDTGTSLGRKSSSKPNFQNVPRTGFGEEIRGCIIAPDGFDIVKADFSNLELRIILHQAGFDITKILKLDPFQWLVDNSNGLFDSVATKMNTGFSSRDWSKSVSHASNLLEGLTLLSDLDLCKPHTLKLIRVGAIRVFHDWMFRGKVVAFTGANLAERLLGAKTEENRKAMLDMQWDIYFKSFPILNEFHRKLLKTIESASVFQIPGGMILDLYGPDLDDAKICAAAVGQGGGAAFTQEAELRFYKRTGIIPFATVHDDVNIYFPEVSTDEEILDKMKILVEPSTILPGMICPAKVLRGKNWKENDMKPLGKIY